MPWMYKKVIQLFLLKLPSLLIFSKKNIYGKWFVNLGRNRVVCILQALHIFKDG